MLLEVSLHTAMPEHPGDKEATYPGYTRRSVALAMYPDGVLRNPALIECGQADLGWTGGETITHVGVLVGETFLSTKLDARLPMSGHITPQFQPRALRVTPS